MANVNFFPKVTFDLITWKLVTCLGPLIESLCSVSLKSMKVVGSYDCKKLKKLKVNGRRWYPRKSPYRYSGGFARINHVKTQRCHVHVHLVSKIYALNTNSLHKFQWNITVIPWGTLTPMLIFRSLDQRSRSGQVRKNLTKNLKIYCKFLQPEWTSMKRTFLNGL